ncbi:MAG TPA: PilZ domain-containing protein [Allosphingosinicella sp.]|nr:PilZ domain-containing protein [Allosphingosinicella sp.]
MHELRTRVAGGGQGSLLARREPKRRRDGDEPSLAGFAIPRVEARTSNQRREDRHLNVVERAELSFRRRKLEVGVVNVSNHGAMIESDIDPRIGERLQIRFDGCNRTDCAVRWIREGRIGLEFSQETEIIASAKIRELVVSGRREGEQRPQPPAPVGQQPEAAAQIVGSTGSSQAGERQAPREPRQSLLWKAVLHWDHGSLLVRVRNISAEGAMLEAREELPVETGVVVDVGEGGTVCGTVRWSRSGQVGVRFDHRFDLRRLARPERPFEHSPEMLKPRYLQSELDPNSPWAAAWDTFTPDDAEADLDPEADAA